LDKEVIKMKQITKNVFVETEFIGCNVTFVTTSEGVVLIDTPQMPVDAVKLKAIIDRYGPVKYVINSEPHIDHISGNCFYDGLGLAHQGARDAVLKYSPDMIKGIFKKVSPDSAPFLDKYYIKPPTLTFSESMSVYLGKHSFNLYHLPGHSPFQVSIYIPEEKVIVTSDNVTYKLLPGFKQAVPYEWVKSLEFLMTLGQNTLVPGHGEVCDSVYLPEMKSVIKDCIDVISGAIKKGWTLKEAQERIILAPAYPLEPKHPMTYEFVQKESIESLYKALSAG
jgi:cyclase